MRLFIAEKPSMGREISKYLSQANVKRCDGYIVHGTDVVTWAYGHVLEQAEPGAYAERYQRWRMEDLPIVPAEWKLLITKSSEKQFHTIARLIQEADEIVHAGDPDREGQLLIDEILTYLSVDKPVHRLLLNALDEASIRSALADLRNNQDFYNLQQSALARSRADWLIGMNLSRAYTLQERQRGNKVTFPVGRVKTPTLALVVRRERELEDFKPVDYFTLKVQYNHPKGSFWATWQPRDEQAGLDPDGRLLDRSIAEALAKRLAGGEGVITACQKNKKKEGQRLPLSLSALQVLAGKQYGYDPQTVLDTAQRLYERKLTSYPRSDCDYLPTNQWGQRQAILQNLAQVADAQLADWARGADASIQSRAWNDKKITAHHAIIPTTVRCPFGDLSTVEQNIYRIIAQAYIAQFYGEHKYEQTKITVEQEGEAFVAHGRVVTDMGWKALYQRAKGPHDDESDTDTADGGDTHEGGDGSEGPKKKGQVIEETGELPAVKKGDTVLADQTTIDARSTKPPSRFTATTLLQAMKEIYKYVRDEALKKQLKDVSGIGTEATRATIISELITRGFLKEEGKKKILKPTTMAYTLVDALPEEMLYPDETAVWEERLALMSEGKEQLERFLADQVAFLERLIGKVKANSRWSASGPMETVTRTLKRNEPVATAANGTIPDDAKDCPQCKAGKLIQKQGKYGTFYGCSNYPNCRHTERSTGEGAPTVVDIDVPASQQQYPCPRCKQGFLVPVEERGRKQWICSHRSTCRTSCVDVNGKPSVYANRDQ